MLDLMPISLVVWYLIFVKFNFYQTIHCATFKGESQGFVQLLYVSGLVATICQIAFLLYYGWSVRWYLPIVLFVVCYLLRMASGLIDEILNVKDWLYIMSLIGFVVWPCAAFFMFRAIP